MASDRLEWAQTHWVEVDLDYADQIAARAEYTLIFIGPARTRQLTSSDQWARFLVFNQNLADLLNNAGTELKPLGMAQGINISNSRQRIPVMELGSEMMAFVSGQTSFAQVTINRLVAETNSLLKKIKEVTVPPELNDTGSGEKGIDFALHGKAAKWPFGLGLVFYADLSDEPIGKLYVEHCKVVGLGTMVGAGQPVIYEGVQILGHRVLEFNLSNLLPEGF